MKFNKFFFHSEFSLKELALKFGIDEKIMKIVLSRGFKTEEEIEEFLRPKTFLDAFSLQDMDRLVKRIHEAINKKEKILIFGDYDVDGVSATAIMLKTLAVLGIKAHYYLPNRYVDGYGLSNDVIDKIKKKHAPNLIITVDCGISCFKEVEYAKSLGIEIVITDHHEIPDELPDTIVVNPKILGQRYSFNGLCGTGVAYKVSEALLGKREAEAFLPIAAIATIADIVPLISENRVIVKEGLKLFEKYLPVGLKALLKQNKLAISHASASDISFKIAPKLNASGRMGDASDSLLLYLETDPMKITKLIDKIMEHNTKRQELCAKVYKDCKLALKNRNMSDNRCIILASKNWDIGILGIVCSRLVDEFNRPVFLFSYENDMLKGSARSIMDINIHEMLSSLKDILESFGGHTMAAGLSLKRGHYDEFIKRINAYIYEKVDDAVFTPISYYDEEVIAEELDNKFISNLEILEPFGCDNPKPKFLLKSENVQINPMRFCKQHASLIIDNKVELLYFNYLNDAKKLECSKLRSFIFEPTGAFKGIVNDFDSGREFNSKISEIMKLGYIAELEFMGKKDAKMKFYQKSELLKFVNETGSNVFGTCFIANKISDFENFVKNYDQENIFNHEILMSSCDGFNAVLLSPVDVSFCENFKKIIFLSPLVDLSYVTKINELNKDAEIFVPMDQKFDLSWLNGIDVSRENFGKIFKAIKARAGKPHFDLISFLEGISKKGIFEAYSAFLVFSELNLIKSVNGEEFKVYFDNKPCNLQDSKIYNMLSLLKEVGSD